RHPAAGVDHPVSRPAGPVRAARPPGAAHVPDLALRVGHGRGRVLDALPWMTAREATGRRPSDQLPPRQGSQVSGAPGGPRPTGPSAAPSDGAPLPALRPIAALHGPRPDGASLPGLRA